MPRRGLRADRDHEVVCVGHLVRGQAEGVDPGVPRLAAREQEAVPRDGVPDRERRPPPGVAVSLPVDGRLDAARLAVALVPQQHTFGGVSGGDAQAHHRLASELLRPLDDVQLRAVVVRTVQQLLHFRGDEGHPLTAPPVRPLTM
jgi:hypothetical protein